MKIPVRHLEQPEVVKIQGNEDWLRPLYQSFSEDVAPGSEAPKLTGELTVVSLTPDSNDFIKVSGRLSYAPILACSRCGEPLHFPLNLKVDVVYQDMPTSVHDSRDYQLNSEELEQYFIDKDCTIDLEVLINDTVQLAIPDQITPDNPGVAQNHICSVNIQGDLALSVALHENGATGNGKQSKMPTVESNHISPNKSKDATVEDESPFAKLKDYKVKN